MKSKRQKTFTLAVTLAGLLALAWLPGTGGASMAANGTTQEKIIVSISNDTQTDDTLYTLNPDGSSQTKLFDFHNHPKHTSGRILQPRVAPDGSAIYFSSDNSYAYTPASRNLFRIASDGSWWDQITPDSNSGKWNQPGPYGTVEGKVTHGDGSPWVNCPVYLEGMGMLSSQADGTFRFENVPQGERFVIAYKPGDTPFDFEAISVVANTTYTVRDLIPNSTYRTSYQYPAVYGDRIYHKLGPNAIWWTDANASAYTNAYTVTLDFCTGVPGVDGFTVGPVSGKLAILDYQEGCGIGSTEHQGLYITDKDGNNRSLLIDMMAAGTNWCNMITSQGIFWSPDESKIAFTWCYNWDTYLMVYDSASGNFLGGVYWDGTSYTVNLHGWSPDGKWLLYSHYDQPENGVLSKIPVNTDGSLDAGSIVNLLTGTRISGATWGTLKSPQRIYLPLVVRNH